MAQQTINVGAAPNDGTGTPLRTAFQYTNSNFSELYTAVGPSGNNIVVPGSATITGDLTVDTSTLKVDSTLDKVGVGVATLTGLQKFNVAGDIGITSDLVLKNSGGTVQGYIFGSGGINYRVITGQPHIWQEAGTELMRLNSTGLGIGATPSKPLHVYNTTESTVWANTTTGISLFRAGGTGGDFYFGIDNSTGGGFGQGNYSRLIYSTGAYPIIFSVNATRAMTLDASGNLLVGTTAMPSGVTYARLVAKSTSADWSGVIWNSNATPYGFRIQHDTDSNGTGNEFLYCLGNGNLRASIRSNGGLANYQANNVSLSDLRLKTDIKPLASYWNKIKSLELVTFKYKDQTHNDDNIGLIAQQVESVAPELVDVDGFGETPSDGVPLKTIYTTDLYHASIKALQEAMTRIEALEAKLA